MYEALEHWKQYKQKKYPTMNELLEMGYTKPGAMVLDEMIEAEEQEKVLQTKIAKEYQLDKAIKDANRKKNFEEFDKWFTKLGKKNGYTKY